MSRQNGQRGYGSLNASVNWANTNPLRDSQCGTQAEYVRPDEIEARRTVELGRSVGYGDPPGIDPPAEVVGLEKLPIGMAHHNKSKLRDVLGAPAGA